MRLAIMGTLLAVVLGACGDSVATTTAPEPAASTSTASTTSTTAPLATTTRVPTTTVPPPTTTVLDRGEVPDDFAVDSIVVAGEAWTVAVADTLSLRQRGLMFVSDLGDLDGMLFVFESDGSGGFWMKDTLLPLDVAFFTVEGALVDVLAMVPCEADPCPVYVPAGDYRYALESEQGRLIGLPADTRLVVGDA